MKKMTAGDVMMFVAQQLDVNPAEMLMKNAGSIALNAVKSGWAKADAIKDAIKGFSDKTKDDSTGIDWSNVEIDESGFKMSCLFDGDSGKKLKEFVKKLSEQMTEFAKDANDGKKKGVDESDVLTEISHFDIAMAATSPETMSSKQIMKNLSQLIPKKAVDEIIKSVKEGVVITTDDGNEFVQTPGSIVKIVLKRDFPDVSKKINELLTTHDKRVAYKYLSTIAYAAKVGEEEGLQNALERAGLDERSYELASKAAKDAADAVQNSGVSTQSAQKLANDDELKKQTAKKAGLKAFTPLGWARLVAKTTGYVLNHGKDVVDALGAKKIANSEDKDVIAEIKTQIENAESSDNEYSDSVFSVRFTVDDFKWHATCIDDRKMKFPEDTLVKKVLSTATGEKFKKYCLNKWKSMFQPDPDGDYSMLPFILKNLGTFGLKIKDDEFFNKVKTVADNIDKIEQQFK